MTTIYEFFSRLPLLRSCPEPSSLHSYGSAIIAVLVGALLAFLYSKQLEKRKAEISMLLEFSADLNTIKSLSEEYWLGNHSDKNKKLYLDSVGYKLRAALMATTEYRELMSSLLGRRFHEFNELDIRLMMAATGGNFQTSKVAASPSTYQEIAFLIFKTEAILRDLRSRF